MYKVYVFEDPRYPGVLEFSHEPIYVGYRSKTAKGSIPSSTNIFSSYVSIMKKEGYDLIETVVGICETLPEAKRLKSKTYHRLWKEAPHSLLGGDTNKCVSVFGTGGIARVLDEREIIMGRKLKYIHMLRPPTEEERQLARDINNQCRAMGVSNLTNEDMKHWR